MIRIVLLSMCTILGSSYDLHAAPVVIEFGGHDWIVKANPRPTPPGPNYFSDDERVVWKDDSGRLHLSVRKIDGQWRCSELICRSFLGYGTYTFKTEGRIDLLDTNVVFAVFTWDVGGDDTFYREIDIEYSRWGQYEDVIGQFTLQPHTDPSHVYKFPIEMEGEYATHEIHWYPNYIDFVSYHGHESLNTNNQIAKWTFRGDDIPEPGKARIRINLWLYKGLSPANENDTELIVTHFHHSDDVSTR